MAKKTLGKAQKGRQLNTTPFYVIFFIALLLYVILQRYSPLAIVLGFAVLFLLVALIAMELLNSVRQNGIKASLIELLAVLLIVIAAWFVLSFVLKTSSPFDVVPSCSMLPSLKRGDLIALQGVQSPTQLRAPLVNVTAQQWQGALSNFSAYSAECVAYTYSHGALQVQQSYQPGDGVGLLEEGSGSGALFSNQTQKGLIKYSCGLDTIEYSNNTSAKVPATIAITIGNATIKQNLNNSIIVYQTVPQDLFYKEGDTLIVHRALAVINASGSYYVLTWGDNNPGLDVQYQNLPPSLIAVQGKVAATIPYLGYLKLAFSSQQTTPQGCNYVTQH